MSPLFQSPAGHLSPAAAAIGMRTEAGVAWRQDTVDRSWMSVIASPPSSQWPSQTASRWYPLMWLNEFTSLFNISTNATNAHGTWQRVIFCRTQLRPTELGCAKTAQVSPKVMQFCQINFIIAIVLLLLLQLLLVKAAPLAVWWGGLMEVRFIASNNCRHYRSSKLNYRIRNSCSIDVWFY